MMDNVSSKIPMGLEFCEIHFMNIAKLKIFAIFPWNGIKLNYVWKSNILNSTHQHRQIITFIASIVFINMFLFIK